MPVVAAIRSFRITALAEAVSYLLLLFIAMPLKYLWDMPFAVRIVGSIHGLLFVLFCFTLLRAWNAAKWPFSRVLALFIASLLPFVPFWMDQRVLLWQKEAAQ